MTQEELLQKLADIAHNKDAHDARNDYLLALYAVVKLHKPCCDNLNELHTGYCLFCNETKLTKYPCPTIEAIEKALA